MVGAFFVGTLGMDRRFGRADTPGEFAERDSLRRPPSRQSLVLAPRDRTSVSSILKVPSKEECMGQIVHTSRIQITREKGPTRKAIIEGFAEPVYYGVHGGIKGFYKVEPEKEHAATLDHIVGAVAG